MGCSIVFLPTAPFIFTNAIDKHRLQWILVNIAEKCGEIRGDVHDCPSGNRHRHNIGAERSDPVRQHQAAFAYEGR